MNKLIFALMQEENTFEQQSSKTDARLYVAPERAELFLERWANETIDWRDFPITPSLSREQFVAKLTEEQRKVFNRSIGFYRRFHDLMPTHGAFSVFRPLKLEDIITNNLGSGDIQFFFESQEKLREAWAERNALRKEASLLLLAGGYMRGTELEPQADKFLMVLLHALKRVHLLKYCLNPACAEPYFIAKRVSQDYCSAPCAKHGQREAQLRWWHEHGAKRRDERLKKKRAKKSQRKRGE